MPRLHALVLCAAPLALSACNPGEAPPPEGSATTAAVDDTAAPAPDATAVAGEEPAVTASPTQDGSDSCGASKVRERWLNALPSADTKSAIAAAVGERPIRYYTEGDVITMDFNENRLNVVLGRDGRIKEFRCG